MRIFCRLLTHCSVSLPVGDCIKSCIVFKSEQRLSKNEQADLQRCAVIVSRGLQDGYPISSLIAGLSKRSNSQVLVLLGCAKPQEKSCSAEAAYGQSGMQLLMIYT